MFVVAKPKRKNSEKRKEKSRDAARSRRSKEMEVFCQLANELPISSSTLSQLDKTSIVRLGITHLNLRKMFQNQHVPREKSTSSVKHKLDQLYYKALDGFLLLVNKDGDLLYTTENSISYLGFTQMDLLGHSVYDFIHPCDHQEMRDIISDSWKAQHSFFVRMKCTLTSKGRTINVKSANYKVIHCLGNVLDLSECQLEPLNLSKTDDNGGNWSSMILICRPILHPSNIDIPLDSKTFITYHKMDMTFTYCDERISELLDYKSNELIGKSLYSYHHALDGQFLEKSFKTLFNKGQSISGVYRFLAKYGGYVWMETQSSVTRSNGTDKREFVICVNVVISGVEHNDEVLSIVQQPSLFDEVDLFKRKDEEKLKTDDVLLNVEEDVEEAEEDEMHFVTEEIFNFAARNSNLTTNHSSKVAKSSLFMNQKSQITDMENGIYGMRAPYISMDDDMIFSESTPDVSEMSTLQPSRETETENDDYLMTISTGEIEEDNDTFEVVNESSVLKNLLLKGEDLSYGYRLTTDINSHLC